MTQEQIAKAVVLITNVIKLNTHDTAVNVRQAIVNELADYLTTDEIILVLTGLFNQLGIQYDDVDDGIQTVINTLVDAPTEVIYGATLQDIAQAGFYVLSIIKGFLPPKWMEATEFVLVALKALLGK